MHEVPERQRLAELLAGEQGAPSAFHRNGTACLAEANGGNTRVIVAANFLRQSFLFLVS